MTRIEEPLPVDPLEAEAVLHVRRQLRHIVRDGPASRRPEALAILFGHRITDEARFRAVARGLRPISDAADLVAGPDGIARLGHDADHVERCRQWLLAEKEAEPAFEGIIAFDLGTLLALSRAKLLARAGDDGERPPIPILVTGETGTGKELLTTAIHTMSGRKGTEPVVIHVAGMARDQIADEIFGHVRGAYTDAKSDRAGRLDEADAGTLHLDEVGDLPPEAQVRLLRVLQNGKYSRIGENKIRTANVRVIAATWHDLDEDMKLGTFRRDLFHRISTGQIRLPPLAQRRTEFGRVVAGMLKRLGADRPLTRSAADALACYGWPGNLRELEDALRVAVASAGAGPVRLEDLPPPIQAHFLRRPIDVRAAGILCDDPDDVAVPDALTASRAATVEAMIVDDTPIDAVPEPIHEFIKAMDGLPDPTGGHQTLMQDFRNQLSVVGLARREDRVAKRLAEVAGSAGLPESAQVAVAAAARRHALAAQEHGRAATAAAQALDLSRSPWGRLYVELKALPILASQDHTKILGFISTLVQLVQTADPKIVDGIRQKIVAGGLRGLIDHGRAIIEANGNSTSEDEHEDEDEDEDDEIGVDLPPGPPRGWKKEQWEALIAMCRTRRDLQDITSLDGKTIKNHLDRLGIAPAWARPRSS